MANYKLYMNRDFAGCRLLAYAYDHCRLRDVRIFMMPGEVETVGVSDGTDTWIAPVAGDPFSVNIPRIMKDILDGKTVAVPVKPGAPQIKRRAVLPGEGGQSIHQSRRALLTPITQAPSQSRSRRVIFA